MTRNDEPAYVTAVWTEFYKTHFGVDVDLSGLQIPARVDGFTRPIIAVREVGIDRVYDTSCRYFKCLRQEFSCLGGMVRENERDSTKGSYAVWVRDSVEADDGLRGMSASGLARGSIRSVTLLERLIYGLRYFLETGSHLDVASRTLCSGSRNADGFVPYVFWYEKELRIGWTDRTRIRPNIISREVVG